MTEVELVSPFVLEYAYKRSLGPVLSRYFTGLREGRLQGVTTASGRVIMPPAEYDPETGEDITGWVDVGPEGEVTTWTWVDTPSPRAPLQEPFAWALIRLDGTDSALLHALKCRREEVKTGMRVRPQWKSTRVGFVTDIACFVPVSSGDVGDTDGQARAPSPFSLPQAGEGGRRPGEGSEPFVAASLHGASEPPAKPVTQFLAPTRVEYLVTAGKVTAEFLRGILKRELNGRRCPSCGRVYIPPRGACPIDGVPTTELVPLSQRGTVTTFSVIRFPFEGQVLTPPYACAHIVLDGADVPLLHIIGDVDVNAVRMGMRVEAVWAEDLQPTLASVRYFRPVDEPDVPYEAYCRHLGEGV